MSYTAVNNFPGWGFPIPSGSAHTRKIPSSLLKTMAADKPNTVWNFVLCTLMTGLLGLVAWNLNMTQQIATSLAVNTDKTDRHEAAILELRTRMMGLEIRMVEIQASMVNQK